MGRKEIMEEVSKQAWELTIEGTEKDEAMGEFLRDRYLSGVATSACKGLLPFLLYKGCKKWVGMATSLNYPSRENTGWQLNYFHFPNIVVMITYLNSLRLSCSAATPSILTPKASSLGSWPAHASKHLSDSCCFSGTSSRRMSMVKEIRGCKKRLEHP